MRQVSDRFGGKPFSRIDLTPMVGVLLTLFVVMATVGWAPEEVEAVELDHPGCSLAPPDIDYAGLPKHVVLSANSDGSISVGERMISRAEFRAELRHLASMKRAPGIWVRADADVDYGTVFALYNEIEKAGLGAEIGIINEELE